MTAAPIIKTLHELIYSRRSEREYTGEKPSKAQIGILLAAAVRAPTAMHEEAWRFLIVQDPILLRRLSDHAKILFAEEAGRLHLDHGGKGLDVFLKPDFNVFYDAGTLIVICGKASHPFCAADCWLAAGNLMLTAHAMGLGTCVIGSAVTAINCAHFAAELGIPPEYSAVAPIIVGKPRSPGSPTARKPPDVIAWR
jgi:nitroreductase